MKKLLSLAAEFLFEIFCYTIRFTEFIDTSDWLDKVPEEYLGPKNIFKKYKWKWEQGRSHN